MKLLVAGGAGFIGSNFIRHMLASRPDVSMMNFDKLTYAGNLENLADASADPRYSFMQGDICNADMVDLVFADFKPDALINFAAETHVDRSIHVGSREFVMTNTVGVQTLLDAVRRHGTKKMIQISTDEVYGSLGLDDTRKFVETTAFEPNVPYAAAKAGGDLMCRAYFKTFDVPVIVTHCSNNYGPFQFPEKLIPVLITNAMEDRSLPIYGDGLNVREWIFADEHSRAVLTALDRGMPGEVYNVGSGHEKTNLEVVREILRLMGKPESLITFVKDRPAHDRRYAIDYSKIRREWNWSPETDFASGLKATIDWYRAHQDWVREIKDASYLSYYDRVYTLRDQTFAD